MVTYDIRKGVKKIKTKTSLSISAITLGVAGLGVAVAIPLVTHADSVGPITFEPNTYHLGDINGQDGWMKTGAYDVAVDSNFGISSFGTQSLRMSDATTSGSFGDQTFAKPLVNAVGESDSTDGTFARGTLQNHFEMQFDIASVLPTLQTGMHVSVSPDRGDGSRMSYLRFEDHSATETYTDATADATHPAGSHYTDGIHIYFDDVTDLGPVGTVATFNETDIATISRSPHTVRLTMDTNNGPSNDVVKVWVDGSLKITGTSWENFYRYDPEQAFEQSPRIVKTILFRESGDSDSGNTGKGFLVDNLTYSSSMNLPNSKDQCMNDGWKIFGTTFKNQGDCVSFVATNGKNQPSGPAKH